MDFKKKFSEINILPKMNINAPTFDLQSSEEKTQIEIRDLMNTQLKTAELQSKTSDVQYKVSLFLTIAAIIISLIPLVKDLIFEKPNYNESIIRISETQSQQSETISNMTTYLLDLQNKVQSLEKENELLIEKLKK